MFPLGQTVITQGANELLLRMGHNPAHYLRLHRSGDWGTMCAEDRELNEQALDAENPDRIMSSYLVGAETIWVITEWDRSVTTILCPDEY